MLIKSSTLYNVTLQYIQPVSHKLDLLWHAEWYFRGEDDPRPNWSGFMQDITVGTHLPPGHFRVLPIIDLNSGDKSCILSTLLFVQEQAKALSMETACITFDQPLWIKAVEVVTANSLNVVCRLGVFHMLMSYLGSTGHVMSGSGLYQALETCYGPNAVKHMLMSSTMASVLMMYRVCIG